MVIRWLTLCFVFSIALCTAVAQQQRSVILDTFVHFEFGKYAITIEGDSIISYVADIITSTPQSRVEIGAHTDAVGSIAANERLSQNRARAVQLQLARYGVDSMMTSLDWKGERDSIAMNLTDEGRQRNRRAQIRVIQERPMKSISGFVRDSMGEGLLAEVVIHGRAFRDTTQSDSTGRFEMVVPDSSVLGLDIFHPGHIYHTEMFNSSRFRELNFSPPPIRTDVKFALHRFYFVGNEAILLKSSEPELQRLYRFMAMNPTVVINIEGHVNYPNNPRVSKTSPMYDLSFRRAKMVYQYLISKDINPARLSFEAFGNWHMVFPTARTEAQQAKNRRVEIRIIDY